MANGVEHQDLIDPFGRVIEDLRISITDRCNFRCTYCMPEEGMTWLDRSQVMSFEEIEHLARIFVERYGVRGIRLTGGEPTVRAHLPVLVAKLAKLENEHGPIDLSMTTNGATMRLVAAGLREAGLKRVNISLDTLDRAKFEKMTRRDQLDNVLDGIVASQEAGFSPVKINAVIERGVNDDELVALATYGREQNVEMRFIEFMPLDAGGHWVNDQVVGQDEILEKINAVYPIEVMPARGAAPADRFRYLDGGLHGDATGPGVPRSGSSRPSPSRSAATAIVCVSPPMATSARACSPRRSSVCSQRCAQVRATTRSLHGSKLPSPRSGRGTASTR